MKYTGEKYQKREPRKSGYFKCVEENYESMINVWESKYERECGSFRKRVEKILYGYLECGDLHCGFARVKCNECKEEYLLPFSCKCRYFCPSCHNRRVVEFGEELIEEVVSKVPHRQWVFSIPKRLRIYFLYDRKLLGKLAKCAWKVLKEYLRKSVGNEDGIPGVVVAIQTFGDMVNFNPHLHIIATDGCFDGGGNYIRGIEPIAKDIEQVFQVEVLRMLIKEGKIGEFVLNNMMGWHNSGFNVYCGKRVGYEERDDLERLAQYIVRAPISEDRLKYIREGELEDGKSKIIYESKRTRKKEVFEGRDFLAKLTTHIPNKGEQLVRYYGYYSNKARGIRKKKDVEIDEDEEKEHKRISIGRKRFLKSWARLIKKVYNVDPLVCSKCNGTMRIVSFVEDKKIIEKILKHLNLWVLSNIDPPTSVNKIERQLLEDYQKKNIKTNRKIIASEGYIDIMPDYEAFCDVMPDYF